MPHVHILIFEYHILSYHNIRAIVRKEINYNNKSLAIDDITIGMAKKFTDYNVNIC